MSKGNKAMQPIKVKDFQNKMRALGFSLDRVRGDHYIYMNDKNEMISVAFKGKEVNPMMWKVIQQRLERNNLRVTQRLNEKVKGRTFTMKSIWLRKAKLLFTRRLALDFKQQ